MTAGVPRGASSSVAGPDGVLVVDKPRGPTSHDVVRRARHVLGTRRIGHLGTLDPLATGVLPLVVGRATRLASLLASGDKVYLARIRLGLATDTYDLTGRAVGSSPPTVTVDVDRARLEAALSAFVGTFAQRPPPFSAKKVGGVRAYALARRQRPPALAPIEVTAHGITLVDIDGASVTCRIRCAPGFYVRSLAHDLGEALGCGGCLADLRRERSGTFGLDNAVTLDALDTDSTVVDRLVPLARLLPELPGVVVTSDGFQRVRHGNPLRPRDVAPPRHGAWTSSRTSEGASPRPRADLEDTGGRLWSAAEPGLVIRICTADGTLVAIANLDSEGVLHPRIVLV